jgi:hypothetical protein
MGGGDGSQGGGDGRQGEEQGKGVRWTQLWAEEAWEAVATPLVQHPQVCISLLHTDRANRRRGWYTFTSRTSRLHCAAAAVPNDTPPLRLTRTLPAQRVEGVHVAPQARHHSGRVLPQRHQRRLQPRHGPCSRLHGEGLKGGAVVLQLLDDALVAVARLLQRVPVAGRK